MRRPVVTPIKAFLLSSAPGLLCAIALPLTGASPDRTVGVAGAVFAIAAFGMQQVQSKIAPARRVIFLAKSRSNFAANILRGVRDHLSDVPAISITASHPPAEIDDVLRWQIDQLRSATVRSAHGLVVIPAADSPDLWHAMAAAIRAGLFVVCVDTKPSNQIFAELGLERPAFVGSDFGEGGDSAGTVICEALKADSNTRAVVALGPDSSWPARERARCILYRLSAQGCAPRSSYVMLANWDEVEGVNVIFPHVRAELENWPGLLVVFCGNDKIAHALWVTIGRQLSLEFRQRLRLVGYDGTTTEDGALLLTSLSGVYATVDTLPFQQGRVAGELILAAFEGEASLALTRYIRPRIVVFEPLISPGNGDHKASSNSGATDEVTRTFT